MLDRRRLLLILWCLAIFAVSSYPHLKPPGRVRPRDKLGHLVEYSVLGYFLGRILWPGASGRTRDRFLLGLAIGSAYGAVDELYQGLIPGRFSSTYDMAADAAGVLLGLAAAWRAAAPVMPASAAEPGVRAPAPGGGSGISRREGGPASGEGAGGRVSGREPPTAPGGG